MRLLAFLPLRTPITVLGVAALVALVIAAYGEQPDERTEEPAAETATVVPVRPTPAATKSPAAPPAASVTTHGSDAPRGVVRIMPLGDSITSGNGDWTADGYRRDLGERLSTAGLTYDFVGSRRAGTGRDRDHEGHGGWTIDQIRSKIDSWLATYRPDIVLLDLGTNDMIKNVAPARAPARLSALIDTILAAAPETKVIVARLSVVPATRQPGWSPRLPEIARRMVAYNAEVPAVVAAKGPRVTLVDMSRVPSANTKDGIHPVPLGYRQMAFQWYQRLRAALPGGSGWPNSSNPFPLPTVGVSTAAAAGGVTVTGRLTGRLSTLELAGVPVQFRYRPLGRASWQVLGRATTSAHGSASVRHRPSGGGDYQVRITGGRASGRLSGLVRVARAR